MFARHNLHCFYFLLFLESAYHWLLWPSESEQQPSYQIFLKVIPLGSGLSTKLTHGALHSLIMLVRRLGKCASFHTHFKRKILLLEDLCRYRARITNSSKYWIISISYINGKFLPISVTNRDLSLNFIDFKWYQELTELKGLPICMWRNRGMFSFKLSLNLSKQSCSDTVGFHSSVLLPQNCMKALELVCVARRCHGNAICFILLF